MGLELRFKCSWSKNDYLTVRSECENVIIEGLYQGKKVLYEFDVPTSIKLAKTIRTHINIVKDL